MGICPPLGQPSWLGMGPPWSWLLSIDSDSHLYQSASEFNSMVTIPLWYKWYECGISCISGISAVYVWYKGGISGMSVV